MEQDAPQAGFYRRNAYPGTASRMRLYAEHAPVLAEQAVAALDLRDRAQDITHLIVASCTGFVAPGLDQLLARRLGLRPDRRDRDALIAWGSVLLGHPDGAGADPTSLEPPSLVVNPEEALDLEDQTAP